MFFDHETNIDEREKKKKIRTDKKTDVEEK